MSGGENDGDASPKQTRKKRRVEGSATPPRKGIVVRLEQSTFDRLNQLTSALKCSRNQYIERLIEFDLDYRERIGPLNSKPNDLA